MHRRFGTSLLSAIVGHALVLVGLRALDGGTVSAPRRVEPLTIEVIPAKPDPVVDSAPEPAPEPIPAPRPTRRPRSVSRPAEAPRPVAAAAEAPTAPAPAEPAPVAVAPEPAPAATPAGSAASHGL